MKRLACLALIFALPAAQAQLVPPLPHVVPANRIASAYVSQDFINEQLAMHLAKSELFKDIKIELDPDHKQLFLRGKIQVPLEEMRAVNLDPKLGAFRFQMSVKPYTTPDGYLVLEFPLQQTFFYPASSRNPKRDRIVIPVQMLSLALASARGYLAALSGDFSGFDRRTKKLSSLMKALDRAIATEKNPDALDDLKTQREGLRLQVEAVPIERKQLLTMAKEYEHIMGFTGEKEMNINSGLAASQNVLMFKLKVSQLVPYLNGVDLGGVRVIHNKKDGTGENYLAVDINSQLAVKEPEVVAKPSPRPGMKTAPALIMRLNQSLLEADAIVKAERAGMPTKIRNLDMQLKDDGLHVTGGYHTFFGTVSFETVIDFISTATDTFEVRVRDFEVAGLDVSFLTKFVLEAMKKRLDATLKGLCQFRYIGEDKARALEVKVDSTHLVPAFPGLHLVGVDVREREFLLKIGRP